MANQTLDFDTYALLTDATTPAPVFEDAVAVVVDDPDYEYANTEPYYYTSRTGRRFYTRPIYFEALPFNGTKCTRVYSWLSTPVAEEGAEVEPVPAVVLLHGGGGTAFPDWNDRWSKKDFASISIAHEGQTTEKPVKGSEEYHNMYKYYTTHEWAGPYRMGAAYSDAVSPLGEQWMFHAVADTLLAHNLLRSLPEINSDQIGITGVSWGGVILSTAIGFDNRFKFAISGYGCGSLSDSLSHMGSQIKYRQAIKEKYDTVWDPVLRIGNATMPSMWMSWPKEKHFPMPDLKSTYMAMPQSNTIVPVIIPNWFHSHYAVYSREENYEFAKSIIFGDHAAWAEQVSEDIFTIAGGEYEFQYDNPPPGFLGDLLEGAPKAEEEASFDQTAAAEPSFGSYNPLVASAPYQELSFDQAPSEETASDVDPAAPAFYPEPGTGNNDPMEPTLGGGDHQNGPLSLQSLKQTMKESTKRLYHFVVKSTQSFDYAALLSSTGSVRQSSHDRTWQEDDSTVSVNLIHCDGDDVAVSNNNVKRCTWSASAVLPENTTSWYIHLCTTPKKKVCISSLYHEDEPIEQAF